MIYTIKSYKRNIRFEQHIAELLTQIIQYFLPPK